MSWANQIHKERAKQAKMDDHTTLCAENFYAVLALSMYRTGYSEEQISEVMYEMDHIFGTESNYVSLCKEETGIEVRIE